MHLKYLLALAAFIWSLFFLPRLLTGDTLPPFTWPVKGEVVTEFRQSYWDSQREKYRKHTGIDIKSTHSLVRASASGYVSYKGFSPTGGLTLVIKHNQKIRTTYLNLAHVLVSPGSYVYQGQPIARIGAEDDPSHQGAHLHFGVIYSQAYLDPQDLLGIDYSSLSRFIYLQYLERDYLLK